MSFLSSLGGLALAIAATLLALLAWLSWRKPTWLFLLALASLAIQPQVLISGTGAAYDWGLHHTLVTWALIVNGWKYGVRRETNWPVLALIVVFVLSLALGNLHPKLTFGFMLMSLAILALPFAFIQVVLEPGSRRVCALAIMLLPLFSVALGTILQILEIRPLFGREWGGAYRLEGAIGIASVFATLAFAGLVVALHESTRRGRWYAAPLAAVNFALAVLSAARMGVLASSIFVVAYAVLSGDLRAKWRARWTKAAFVLAFAGGALILYWPTLEARMFSDTTGAISLSGRGELWSFYYQEFLLSPLFGRGLGAGFIAVSEWKPGLSTPHNEYLHLLVIGGGVGLLFIIAGVVAWYRGLLRTASPNDRACLLALIPALALYAATNDLLLYTSALALYAYFGVLLTKPSPLPAPPSLVDRQVPEPSTDEFRDLSVPGRP